MEQNFERAVRRVLSNALDGQLRPGDLYEALTREGVKYSQSTMRKKLCEMEDAQQLRDRGPWSLAEPRQGSGELSEVESYHSSLETHDQVLPNPPIETRPDLLPISELRWGAFESLCLNLLGMECEVPTLSFYGLTGQNQRGIDVLGYDPDADSYVVVQCKRYQSDFSPGLLVKAVDRFLEGEWQQASKFIVAVTRDASEREFADEVLHQRKRLRAEGFEFEVWDQQLLSSKLRERPELVERYFGIHWLRAFVGEPHDRKTYLILNATSKLNGRLPNDSGDAFADALEQRGHQPADSVVKLEIEHPDGFDPKKWDAALQRMKHSISIWRTLKSSNPEFAGTAVFPLAKVSLLFALGVELGDTDNFEFFRYERERDTWAWDKCAPAENDYYIVSPEQPCESGHVALLVSTSRSVDQESALEAIQRGVGEPVDVDVWELREPEGINSVQHVKQLVRFRRTFQRLCDEIYESHQDRIDLHVFSCAAAPFVVAMGQAYLDGRPRRIQLYEYQKGGIHHRVLTL